MGIEVLPPDVNESELDFAPVPERRADDPVRAVRGAQRRRGRRAADHRRAPREGRVHRRTRTSAARWSPRVLTKKVLESPDLRGGVRLVRVPAARARGEPGQGLRPISPSARPRPPGSSRCSAVGTSRGGERDRRVACSRATSSTSGRSCAWRRRCSGQFVTDHPLLGVKDRLAAQTDMEIAEIREPRRRRPRHGRAGSSASWPASTRSRASRTRSSGSRTSPGASMVVAFPSVYEAVPHLIEPDAIVLVKGRIDLRGRELQIRAIEMREPDLGPGRHRPSGRPNARGRPPGARPAPRR